MGELKNLPMKRLLPAVLLTALLLFNACSKSPDTTKKTEEKLIAVTGERKAPSSRPAMEGCQWENFLSESMGVATSIQKCAAPAAVYTFSEKAGALTMTPASEPTKAVKVIESFQKPVGQPVEETIEKEFLAKVAAAEHKQCRIVSPAPLVELNDSGKQTLAIVPVEGYAKQAAERRATDPNFTACGPYGQSGDVSYFEYHPNETRGRFVFVRLVKDAPLFDEQMIRLKD
jgi:hypothetical protein